MSEPSPEVDLAAHRLIGAAIEVHRDLGPGYLESIYEEALAVELGDRGIPFVRQAPIPVQYRGRSVGTHRADLIVEEKLIVELKAVEKVLPIHTAQVISYLKASRLTLALIVNFNVTLLRDGIKRAVLS